MHRTFVGAIVLALMAACGAPAEPEASGPDTSGEQTSGQSTSAQGERESVGELDVVVRAVADIYGPLYWAESQGYFEREGVDVTVSNGGEGTVASLVSGRADLMGASVSSVLGIANEDKDPKIIFALRGPLSGYVYAADPSITSPAQCESVTSSTPGSNTYAWTMLMQKAFGVEWELAQLADPTSFPGNVIAGRTDCGTGSVTYYQKAIDEGKIRMIFDPNDPSQLPPGWTQPGLSAALTGMSDVLDEKSDAITAFLTAYTTATEAFAASDPSQIAEELSQMSDWAAYRAEELVGQVEVVQAGIKADAGLITSGEWAATIDFYQNGGFEFLSDDPKWSHEARVSQAGLESVQ